MNPMRCHAQYINLIIMCAQKTKRKLNKLGLMQCVQSVVTSITAPHLWSPPPHMRTLSNAAITLHLKNVFLMLSGCSDREKVDT